MRPFLFVSLLAIFLFNSIIQLSVAEDSIPLEDIDIPPFTGDYSHLESNNRSWEDENIRIEHCGQIEEISGEPRTKGPWVASIFLKRRSGYKFLVTGTLLSPTLVLSIFGGPYGILPKGVPGKYALIPPELLYVGVGLKSAELTLNATDKFSQFSEVNHIIPFNRHHARNIHYHLFLIHLKSPFDITTNYVRPICVHLDPRSYVHIVKKNPKLVSDVPRSFNWKGFVAGYLDDGSGNAKVLSIADGKAGYRKVCDSAFKYYYKNISDSAHVYCTRYKQNYLGDQTSKGCWTYGSPMVVYVNALKRWMVGGLTALIPRKRRSNTCDASTLYFNANFVYGPETEWMVETILCGPNSFACSISGKCIPLTNLCNGIKDCENGDDEESIFCNLTNHCKHNDTIPCGYKGQCISPESLCDDVVDCKDGSDELRQECIANKPDRFNSIVNCIPMPISEGIKINCFNKVGKSVSCNNPEYGDTALLSCEKFYTSKLKYGSIEMRCNKNGFWDNFRAFACEPECGIIGSPSDTPQFIYGGKKIQSDRVFPWYASVYRKLSSSSDRFEFICGGSLVETNVIITAANCFYTKSADISSSVSERKAEYQVVLSPISSDLDENKQSRSSVIAKVVKYWIPKTYSTNNLESDIAIARLDMSVKYNDHIRPVCYLTDAFQEVPDPNSKGKVAGFGIDESGSVSSSLKFTDLEVTSTEYCSHTVNNQASFCAGLSNDTDGCKEEESGGGIVFPYRTGRSTKYVLKGITSHARSKRRDKINCYLNDYTVFTHVDYYANWLNIILEQADVDDENLIANE